MTDQVEILANISEYYSAKLRQHGATPHGVDWNAEEGQIKRFFQLSKIIQDQKPFTLNDLGCGYGALYTFLKQSFDLSKYSGFDISEPMIETAKAQTKDCQEVRFYCSASIDQPADYSIASGVFNVRLNLSDDQWLSHMIATLDNLNENSKRGFSFNCLTIYSDAERKHDYLYYADPGYIFNLCKKRFARNVALLHDYDLYEFTVLVRK